jgi:hypothetical protein
MKKIILFIMSITIGVSSYASTVDDDFAKMKSLVGKWTGTLEWSTGDEPETLNLDYSIRSNGSAILEESNQGGVEMLTIFNVQNDKLQSTHYCGLRNKPVSYLVSSSSGIMSFKTDIDGSGIDKSKESFVISWAIGLIEGEKNKFNYEYKVHNPDGSIVTRTAVMKRVI